MNQMTPHNLIHDFGGDGPVLHLAHANGFPPGTYRPLADTLTGEYHVIGVPARPLWPGTLPESAPTWRPMADDLIGILDESGLTDLVGIGHSLGGVLSLWAAIKRPDLMRAVVLIDPVILPPAWLWMIRLSHRLRLQHRLPLVQSALRRRQAWTSRQACFEQYRHKTFFANWSDSALWAYVEAGTRPGAGGQVELVYPLEWEAHIFSTAPTGIWRDVPRLRTPALVIRGEHSQTFQPKALSRLARLLPQATTVTIPDAGHLVPMERPQETGKAIRIFLENMVRA